MIRNKAQTCSELMCGSAYDGLINKITVNILLNGIIFCQPEIRILLMIESGLLQADGFVFFPGKHIPDF